MSNYAINVRCTVCGNWRVVTDPQPGFDKTKFVCNDCINRQRETRVAFLESFRDWVAKNHPRIYRKFLKEVSTDVR